ncbi:MAG: bacteriohemerythrin [Lachnospiraceae bacterium]|nr:bacteriohemerythrin [Lachnospiraceae bacterium]
MRAVFDETLITGNALIDGQHKELIDRINKLLILCENDKPAKREAIRLLDYLIEYTEFHFGEEEKLQEELGYPGLAEHKKKHEELRETVKVLYEMLEEQEGPTDAFVTQVNKNVTEWLYHHIHGFDRSVAEFAFMRENESRL